MKVTEQFNKQSNCLSAALELIYSIQRIKIRGTVRSVYVVCVIKAVLLANERQVFRTDNKSSQ